MEQIQARLQTISLEEKYTDWMSKKVDEWENEKASKNRSEMQNLDSQINAGQARLEKLVSAYLDGDIPKQIYLKKKDEIMRACAALEEQRQDFVGGRNQWVEPLREWILDTKQEQIRAFFFFGAVSFRGATTGGISGGERRR